MIRKPRKRLKLKTESAAGAVILNKKNEVLLIFKYWTKSWEFPQGSLEKGESPDEAARREIAEETTLTKIKFAPGFQMRIYYQFIREEYFVKKSVILFLARAEGKVKLSSREHLEYTWVPIKRAYDYFRHENHKRVLRAVEKWLNKC